MIIPSKKYLPITGIVLLLVVIGFYLIKARNRGVEDQIVTDIAPEEGLKLKNIHYIQNSPDEGMKWVLDAQQIKFSMDRKHISFKDFSLRLEPENRPPIVLKGDGGDYDKTSSEITLRGGLTGYTGDGYKIITEHILYSQKESNLKAQEKVKLIGPFFSVAGQGLYIDLETETLRVQSHVTTLIDRESLVL